MVVSRTQDGKGQADRSNLTVGTSAGFIRLPPPLGPFLPRLARPRRQPTFTRVRSHLEGATSCSRAVNLCPLLRHRHLLFVRQKPPASLRPTSLWTKATTSLPFLSVEVFAPVTAMGTGASVEDRQPKVEDEPPLQPNPARYLGSAEGPLDRSSSRVRHVRVERTFLGLQTFYHHGVDLGDGRVAHYSKDPTTEPVRPTGACLHGPLKTEPRSCGQPGMILMRTVLVPGQGPDHYRGRICRSQPRGGGVPRLQH